MWKLKPPRSDSRRFYFYDSFPWSSAKKPPPVKNVFTENQLNIYKYPYRF